MGMNCSTENAKMKVLCLALPSVRILAGREAFGDDMSGWRVSAKGATPTHL